MEKIILADSHPMTRTILEGILTKAGYEVVSLPTTCAELKKEIKKHKEVGVVIVDTELPGDPFGLVREQGGETPYFVAISQYTYASFVENFIISGGKGYLLKENAGKQLPKAVGSAKDGRIYFNELVSSGEINSWYK